MSFLPHNFEFVTVNIEFSKLKQVEIMICSWLWNKKPQMKIR